MRVIQRAFRRAIAGQTTCHELLVSHCVAVLADAVWWVSGIANG
jgi:hypothetical protein